METYITICKIDSQWEFADWLRKLKQGLCINLDWWDWEGDRRKFQKGGDTCIPMADSLEGMMLKLKLQYFGHLMRRVDSLEKTLMLGGIVPFCKQQPMIEGRCFATIFFMKNFDFIFVLFCYF